MVNFKTVKMVNFMTCIHHDLKKREREKAASLVRV